MAPGLPRLLAPVLPTTYSLRFLLLGKANVLHWHSGSPYHAYAHCRGFAPAAPLRARVRVSVPFSGLHLSVPLRIIGLVSHYLTNYLIRRRPILWRRSFGNWVIPNLNYYMVLALVSQGYPIPKGRLSTCYWAFRQWFFRGRIPWLAWLSRIPIAATSRRINENCVF